MKKYLVETIDLLAVLDDRPLSECYSFTLLGLINKKIIPSEQTYTCTFETKLIKDDKIILDTRKIRIDGKLPISKVVNGFDKEGLWEGAIRFYRNDILKDLESFKILEAKCLVSCLAEIKRRF